MARQRQRQCGKIELLFARLINATVFDRQPQGVLQVQDARADFGLAVFAEKIRYVGGLGVGVECDGVGLLDVEVAVCIGDEGRLLLDGGVGFAIGGFAVIVCGTAGQRERLQQPR